MRNILYKLRHGNALSSVNRVIWEGLSGGVFLKKYVVGADFENMYPNPTFSSLCLCFSAPVSVSQSPPLSLSLPLYVYVCFFVTVYLYLLVSLFLACSKMWSLSFLLRRPYLLAGITRHHNRFLSFWNHKAKLLFSSVSWFWSLCFITKNLPLLMYK